MDSVVLIRSYDISSVKYESAVFVQAYLAQYFG